MKKLFGRILSFIVCGLLTVGNIFAQNSADERVGALLNSGDWFALRRFYQSAARDSLSPMLALFAESMLAHNFNQPEKAVEAISALIDKHANEIGAGNVLSMGYLLAANNAHMGNYERAADILADFIRAFEQHVDSTLLQPYRSAEKQNRQLAKYDVVNNVVVQPSADCHIPFRLDSVGREGKRALTIVVPSTVNGLSQDAVFDSGAGVNIVSTEAAKRLGLKLLDIPTCVSGIGTQHGFFAIADKLQMGELTVKNVPFFVVDISSGVDSLDHI